MPVGPENSCTRARFKLGSSGRIDELDRPCLGWILRSDLRKQPTEIMIEFTNKILFVGYGAVAECTLPSSSSTIKVPAKNVTVMDFENRAESSRSGTAKGVNFVQDRVTRENLGALLGRYVSAGDIIIDLAWNIDALEILQWCHDRGVRYINTSTELWDPYQGFAGQQADYQDSLLAPVESAPPACEVAGQGSDGGH